MIHSIVCCFSLLVLLHGYALAMEVSGDGSGWELLESPKKPTHQAAAITLAAAAHAATDVHAKEEEHEHTPSYNAFAHPELQQYKASPAVVAALAAASPTTPAPAEYDKQNLSKKTAHAATDVHAKEEEASSESKASSVVVAALAAARPTTPTTTNTEGDKQSLLKKVTNKGAVHTPDNDTNQDRQGCKCGKCHCNLL